MAAQIRRFPFLQSICSPDTDLTDVSLAKALAQLRLRIQQVPGCNDRKALVSRHYIDVEINPDTLRPQAEGELTPLERFDFGVQTAIRQAWNDDLFPDVPNEDAESIGFEEPFYVPVKGADLTEEPEADTAEEPEAEEDNEDNEDAAAPIMQIVRIEEDPNDNLSPEEILELLTFWRRINDSGAAIQGWANLRDEAASQLDDELFRLGDEHAKLFKSGRHWTYGELQYELAGNAEIFRFIAGVLRYIDGFDSHLTPSEQLLQRLAFIANRNPLPLKVTEDGITFIAPIKPVVPKDSPADADGEPEGDDPDSASADTDPTVPHQRSSTEDGTTDGDDNNT